MNLARILIADSHRGARQALHTIIERQADLRVIGVADSASDTLEAAAELHPDLVLLDQQLIASDATLPARLAHLAQPSRILLLVAPPDVPDDLAAAQLGAVGAFSKTAGRDAVTAAIRRALAAPLPALASTPPASADDEFPARGAGTGSPFSSGFSFSLGAGAHDLTTHTAEAHTWRFREALSRWATGVAVVICRAGDTVEGITVSSLTSLSLDPPLILMAMGEGQRILPTLVAGAFTVSILGAEQEPLAEHFAGQGDPALRPELLEDDVIAGSRAALICSPWANYPGGDHRIVVGHVERIWLGAPDEPLLYFGREYRSLPPSVV
jgi:flavin reductase (NADH)